MKLTLITFLIVVTASAQSFNFQISGGVADMSETPQGASLFYSVGVGYALDSNFGITLKGRRSYFENAYPQDNYDVVGSYKIINNRVYDLTGLVGMSYVRSPFYLNGGNRSDIDDYFSPVIGLHNLVAIDDLIDLDFYVEATTAKKLTTYVGLGVVIHLVFETENRAKRFY